MTIQTVGKTENKGIKTKVTGQNLMGNGYRRYENKYLKNQPFYQYSYEKVFRLENGLKYHLHFQQHKIRYNEPALSAYNGRKFFAEIQIEVCLNNPLGEEIQQIVELKFNIDKDSSIETVEHMAAEYVKVFPLN